MVNRTAIAVVATGALFATSSTAMAQRWEGGPPPRDGACFYQDAEFSGPYFCVESGRDLETMPSGANDRISSIRLFGRAEVTVYRDPRFQGDALRFESSVRNLKDEDFNDKISSIEIDGRSRGGGRARGRGRGDFGSQNPETIIRRAYQDLLERDPDQSGMRTYRRHIIDDGWTEQDVRDDIRKSREYREKNTMTRAKAQDIVRRAYLAVLKREPDAASQGWVNNVLRDGWTQEDVERELRRSPEYRERNR